jgi:hypothetical protein
LNKITSNEITSKETTSNETTSNETTSNETTSNETTSNETTSNETTSNEIEKGNWELFPQFKIYFWSEPVQGGLSSKHKGYPPPSTSGRPGGQPEAQKPRFLTFFSQNWTLSQNYVS